MLEVANLRAAYGAAEVVRGVSLRVPAGTVTMVAGPNGAGKTTLARAVAGLHRARGGAVRVGGREVSGLRTVEVARAGVALVPQGRRVFGSLTIAEHLRLAARHRGPRAMSTGELLELFPRLGERARVRARALSGGEQQMLAIARAVVRGPDVLVMDEPTEGLAPIMVDMVTGLVRRLRADGVAVVVMEQSGPSPFTAVADETLLMDRGEIHRAPKGVQP